MIDRQGGKLQFCCDGCGEVKAGCDTDFDIAWAALKRDGWKARKIAKEWLHFCETCKP